MHQRIVAIATAVLMILCAAPVRANTLTSAVVEDDCVGYEITVQGTHLPHPSTVDYRIVLSSSSGNQTVTGSIPVTPNKQGQFSATQTEPWSAFGITLNGTYTLSGKARLESSGSTVNISFTHPTLVCRMTSCTTGATSNFNNNQFSPSDAIWFNSVFNVSGLPASGGQLYISSSTITYQANGTLYTIPVPNAAIIFSPSFDLATTSFSSVGTLWITKLPTYHLAGNDFATGVTVPAADGPPPGTKNIAWNVVFSSPDPNVSVNFQWAAAVYSEFSSNYNALGVKPVDDGQGSIYKNSDHAGTPENFKSYVVGGGTGGGGSNYTGSYSGTASCQLVPPERNTFFGIPGIAL